MLEKLLTSTTSKFFKKCLSTFKTSHAHLQCAHNNCTRLDECQLKGVEGVDYTKQVLSIQNMLEKLLLVQLHVNFSKNV
jgi:hypothetical protein